MELDEVLGLLPLGGLRKDGKGIEDADGCGLVQRLDLDLVIVRCSHGIVWTR